MATATQRRGHDEMKAPSKPRGPGLSLVDPANFLLATRDTGYKTTALAIAELVDNSLQAYATEVQVEVAAGRDDEFPLEITVMDNGSGMEQDTLAAALTFGGSTRFGDRSALGRYGMGLPNGALSRARRVEVYSWMGPTVWMGRLDVDEVARKRHGTLPPISEVVDRSFLPATPSGTVVRLLRCDRIEYRRVSTVVRHLGGDLGRIYRHFIAAGVDLVLNGSSVTPIDPLMLDSTGRLAGTRQFGDTLVYSVDAPEGSGQIKVRFSELPIERWHSLTSTEKRQLGITGSSSVSVLRAAREIDRGWFFMGTKRRENYDDWWRCEVCFEPVLDELFGLTHAKQSIAPTRELLDLLAPDLEPIGRALNSRVRRRFELLKVSTPLGNAERRAARAEVALPPLPRNPEPPAPDLEQALEPLEATRSVDCPYQLVVSELPTTAAFETVVREGRLVVALNSRHPLYRDLYGPLATSEAESDRDVATHVALTVLAAARAEWLDPRKAGRAARRRFRQAWSDVMASFFNAQA